MGPLARDPMPTKSLFFKKANIKLYQAAMNPTNTVFDAKRMICRKFSDPLVQKDMQHCPFKVIRGEADRPRIEVQWVSF